MDVCCPMLPMSDCDSPLRQGAFIPLRGRVRITWVCLPFFAPWRIFVAHLPSLFVRFFVGHPVINLHGARRAYAIILSLFVRSSDLTFCAFVESVAVRGNLQFLGETGRGHSSRHCARSIPARRFVYAPIL